MFTPAERLEHALRRLALPVAADREALVREAVAEKLTELNVPEEDWASWVEIQATQWEQQGQAPPAFREVVRAALRAGDPQLGDRLARKYFEIHKSLAAHHLYDHGHATMALSHARLAAVLAREEQLSAAMVAEVLKARDHRTPLAWPIVQKVLKPLGFGQSLTKQMMQDLLARDEVADVELFGDSDFAECAARLREVGEEVHFEHDLGREALALFPLGGTGEPLWQQSGGHLAMLHYCCAQAEYFDHKISAIYEFTPRGQAAEEVVRAFRESGAYTARENPFLNNAKSAPALDREWAWTKGRAEEASAHALANVVKGLDALAFPSRRYVAGYLRAWLTRIVRAAGDAAQVEIPTELTDAEALDLAREIAKGPTGTRGVLEQRLVDALGVALHGSDVARGLGDAVNANNLARRKLGDVEFEVNEKSIIAYEPHAGTLRQLYVDGHDRSIERVAPHRLREWGSAAGTQGAWELEVVFVAFDSDDLTLPDARTIELPGEEETTLTVSYSVTSYADLVAEAEAAARPLGAAMSRYLLEPLRAPHVPGAIKQAVCDRLP